MNIEWNLSKTANKVHADAQKTITFADDLKFLVKDEEVVKIENEPR